MENTYTTHLGDTWDLIAYRVYGNVNYTGWLIDENKVRSIYRSFRLARDAEGLREDIERRIDGYINRLSIETDIPFE